MVVSVPMTDANWVAVDPLSNRVFVSSRGQDLVYCLHGDDLRLLGSAKVGHLPFGLAANATNRLLYVANYGSGSISLLSMDTCQVLATSLTGGGPTFVAVDQATGLAYAPLHPGNKVARFRDGSYLGNFTVRGEQVFAIALDTGATPKRLYIGTRARGGGVLVYNADASPPTYMTTLTPAGFVYSIGVDVVRGSLFAIHSDTNGDNARFMTVYDRSGAILTSQPVDLGVNTFDGGGVGVVSSSGRIYVAGTDCVTNGGAPCAWYASNSRVQMLNGVPPALQASLTDAVIPRGPFGVAIDESRGRVYVTSKGAGGWLSAISDASLPGP